MSGRFDPYHKWLGIPSHEQPANYYRLLGLELFEEDLDTIECAADRLMKYVHEVATVEQRQAAQEVLEELSAAKRCLLIVERKQAYDAGLRAGRATTRHTRQAEPARRSAPPAAMQFAPLASQTRTTASRQPKAKQTPLPWTVIASAGALMGVSTFGFVFLRGDADRAKQVAATSEVLETSEVLKQKGVAPNVSLPRANATASSETREQNADAIVDSKKPVPAADSSLPEFVSQTPSPDQSSNIEDQNAEPIEMELPAVVVSDSVVEASVDAGDVKDFASMIEPAVDSDLARSAENRGLLRELWTNVTGSKVEEFVQYVADHPQPNQTETIDRFEPPEDFDDQYGQRIRGYLHPPTTGSYEFSIRANAEGWLYVSADALPQNKQRVEAGAKIELEASKAYYVEALHKESTGRDFLSIGWKLPDGSEEKPIPSERLSVHHRIAPRHETEFVVLTPLSAESSSGRKFDLLDDGLILAIGHASAPETYQLTFQSEIETITALRIEAIPHESLPAAGPGRGVGGRFVLTEIAVTMVSGAPPETSHPVRIASMMDDTGHDLRRIVDGDEKTYWRASGRGKPAAAILAIQDPMPVTGGTVVQVVLHQRESLGCLRVLATSAPDPRSRLKTPARSSQDEALYSLFVNLGGDAFTTPDGVRWQESKLFDNETFGHEGGRGVSEELIANKVQGSAQRGITAFRAMVPEGTYDVTLYFCEYWSTTPTSRQFAIAAEQRVVTASFDLFQAAGGFAKPFVYPIRKVAVTDGRLDLQFKETSEGASAILNAVSIQQVR